MGAFLKNRPHSPEKLLKVDIGIAVKLAKTPPSSAQIVRWWLHCPTQMFLRLRANEKPRFATVHTDVLIAIRLRFKVANHRFSNA